MSDKYIVGDTIGISNHKNYDLAISYQIYHIRFISIKYTNLYTAQYESQEQNSYIPVCIHKSLYDHTHVVLFTYLYCFRIKNLFVIVLLE